MKRSIPTAAALAAVASLALAACSGGGSGSTTTSEPAASGSTSAEATTAADSLCGTGDVTLTVSGWSLSTTPEFQKLADAFHAKCSNVTVQIKEYDASQYSTLITADLAANGVGFLVMYQNSFAAPVVKIQKDRGQRAVDTGLYAHVRHPMYAGALLFFIGLPLLLGSWYGLWFFPVFTVLFSTRAVLEERTLIRELDGYADYAARVRYRLVPGVW